MAGALVLMAGLPLVVRWSAAARAGADKATTTATNGGFRLAGTPSSSAAALSFRQQLAQALHGPLAAASVRAADTDSDAVRVDAMTAQTSQSFDNDGNLISD